MTFEYLGMFEELVVFQRLSKFLPVTQLAAKSVKCFSLSYLPPTLGRLISSCGHGQPQSVVLSIEC